MPSHQKWQNWTHIYICPFHKSTLEWRHWLKMLVWIFFWFVIKDLGCISDCCHISLFPKHISRICKLALYSILFNGTSQNSKIGENQKPEWFPSDWALGRASVDEDKGLLGNPLKKIRLECLAISIFLYFQYVNFYCASCTVCFYRHNSCWYILEKGRQMCEIKAYNIGAKLEICNLQKVPRHQCM